MPVSKEFGLIESMSDFSTFIRGDIMTLDNANTSRSNHLPESSGKLDSLRIAKPLYDTTCEYYVKRCSRGVFEEICRRELNPAARPTHLSNAYFKWIGIDVPDFPARLYLRPTEPWEHTGDIVVGDVVFLNVATCSRGYIQDGHVPTKVDETMRNDAESISGE